MTTYCTVCDDSGEIALRDVYSANRLSICDVETEICEACPRCRHCGTLMRDSLGCCAEIYEGDWACSPECAALMISGEPVLEAIEFQDVLKAAELLSCHTTESETPAEFDLLECLTRAIAIMAKEAADNVKDQSQRWDSHSALVEFARSIVIGGGAS